MEVSSHFRSQVALLPG